MSLFNRIATAALGLFLVSSGAAKFAGGHVFAVIESESGIGIFDPFLGYATGIAEILAGALILFPAGRLVGAAGAATIMAGAIAFHLSPWLGVAMPAGTVDGAAAPWTSADFTTETTVMPFALALIALTRSLLVVRQELARRRLAESAATGALTAGAEPVAV